MTPTSAAPTSTTSFWSRRLRRRRLFALFANTATGWTWAAACPRLGAVRHRDPPGRDHHPALSSVRPAAPTPRWCASSPPTCACLSSSGGRPRGDAQRLRDRAARPRRARRQVRRGHLARLYRRAARPLGDADASLPRRDPGRHLRGRGLVETTRHRFTPEVPPRADRVGLRPPLSTSPAPHRRRGAR